jgi:hypothetical protein
MQRGENPMSDEPTTVATFSDAFEANLAKSLLEEAGIRALITGDAIESTWHLGGAFGGVKLLVTEWDLAEAKRLLAEWQCDQGMASGPAEPDCE